MLEGIAASPSTRLVLGSIIVMDDDPRTVEFVKEVVEGFGGRIHKAASAEQVLELAKAHEARYFLLDIDMGEGRTREGLRALRALKQWWLEVFVVLLSNHGELEKPAERLGCSFFRKKTASRMEDAHVAVVSMLRNAERAAHLALSRAEPEPSEIDEHRQRPSWYRDLDTYLGLRSDPELLNRVVAIVDGEVIEVGDSEEDVRALAAASYPNSDRLVARVGEEIPELDLQRPIEVIDWDAWHMDEGKDGGKATDG